MAIIIEEEERRAGLLTIVMYLIFLLIVGAGLYYLFFKNPGVITVVAPESFKSTEQLSKIALDLDPNAVIESPAFKALLPHVAPGEPTAVGRQNPFLGF